MALKPTPRKGKIAFAYQTLKNEAPEEAKLLEDVIDSGAYTAADISRALSDTMRELGYRFNVTARAMSEMMSNMRQAALTFKELQKQIERGERDA